MKLIVTVGGLLLCSLAHAQKPEPKPGMDKLLDKLTFTKDKSSLPYRLLKPDGYDKDGKDRYPLVVFLHGIVGRGTDNEKQLRSGVEEFVKDATPKKHPCFLAVPQCPPDKLWVNVSPKDAGGNLPLAKGPTEPTAMVLDLIEAVCKEYRIDKDRIYLTGVSMGGYGTWDLVSRRPELFAAAIPVSGGGDPAQAEKLAKLPIWAFHGGADPLVPVERARDMIAAIKKAGGEPKYTEYKGVGHDSWTPTYRDNEVLDWLFEQKKGK
ncbi:MAG TPA: prolyl oligopeptidase family serine peptidase [Gemmata sp.]|jgi:predicted peptidase|nr:prolyl oligopeptidase family serine peptidase [Gemmata sp.]